MIFFVFGGFLLWGLLLLKLDRPTEPAWKVRNTYRWLNLFLVFLLMACAVKMTAYRVELRTLIQSCQ